MADTCTCDDFRATESLLQKDGYLKPEQETQIFLQLVLEFMETNNRPANTDVLGSSG